MFALLLGRREDDPRDRAERQDQLLLRLALLRVRADRDEAVSGLGRDRVEREQRSVAELELDDRLRHARLLREALDMAVDAADEVVLRSGSRDPRLDTP